MKLKRVSVTLNVFFVIILFLGLGALTVVGGVLLQQERERTEKRWQTDMIQKSSSATSSYYASLITKLVLQKKDEVASLLDLARDGENLQAIEIVTTDKIAINILETCAVDNTVSFFHQVPACYEINGDTFVIYHELRSTGYNLGYLKKTLEFPRAGLFDNEGVTKNVFLVMLCFSLVTMLSLLITRYYFIKPVQRLIQDLAKPEKLATWRTSFGIKEIKMLANAIQEAFEAVSVLKAREKKHEVEVKMVKLASQVAHDIRSPLAALHAASGDLGALPEDTRILLRSAIQSIDDIANDLAFRDDSSQQQEEISSKEEACPHLLPSLIDTIVSQKRIQYRGQEKIRIETSLDKSSYDVFAQIQPSQFKRVLSNLLNNAVEALEKHEGTVVVSLSYDDLQIKITVADNGKGIPNDVLPQLMQKNMSFNKEGGKGLGLKHAREKIEEWKGAINIESQEGKGTQVTVSLPRVKAPMWFVPELLVYEHTIVVILDDDHAIHQVWRRRFEQVGLSGQQIINFTNVHELFAWHAQQSQDMAALYLCDYEILGQPFNGLEVISKLQVADRAVLVTSHFEEKTILERIQILGVPMIPKSLAGYVPIKYILNDPQSESVLIDDDRITRMTWHYYADLAGIRLASFSNHRDFFAACDSFKRDINIYIDSNLGHGIKGELVAKDIKSRGFKNVFLTTGTSANRFPRMDWISGIIGKEPPFIQKEAS